jgi:hypothetical protein
MCLSPFGVKSSTGRQESGSPNFYIVFLGNIGKFSFQENLHQHMVTVSTFNHAVTLFLKDIPLHVINEGNLYSSSF